MTLGLIEIYAEDYGIHLTFLLIFSLLSLLCALGCLVIYSRLNYSKFYSYFTILLMFGSKSYVFVHERL